MELLCASVSTRKMEHAYSKGDRVLGVVPGVLLCAPQTPFTAQCQPERLGLAVPLRPGARAWGRGAGSKEQLHESVSGNQEASRP